MSKHEYLLKTLVMKRISMALLLLVGVLGAASAQERKWEHSVNLSVGLFLDGTTLGYDYGLSTRLGYGVAYRFAERFSVKSGVAYRADMESPIKAYTYEGADYDAFEFVEVPLVARYHTKDNLVLGLGPVFSFCTNNDTYYIDPKPDSPLNGKTKIKDCYVALQPSIMYQWEHFSLGVEANIGLMDVKLNHGLTTGSKYLHQVMGCVAYRF